MTENNYTTMKMKGMIKKILIAALAAGFSSLSFAGVVLELDGDCSQEGGKFCYQHFDEIQFKPGEIIILSKHQFRKNCQNLPNRESGDPVLIFDGNEIAIDVGDDVGEIIYLPGEALIMTSKSGAAFCDPPGDVVFRDKLGG